MLFFVKKNCTKGMPQCIGIRCAAKEYIEGKPTNNGQ